MYNIRTLKKTYNIKNTAVQVERHGRRRWKEEDGDGDDAAGRSRGWPASGCLPFTVTYGLADAAGGRAEWRSMSSSTSTSTYAQLNSCACCIGRLGLGPAGRGRRFELRTTAMKLGNKGSAAASAGGGGGMGRHCPASVFPWLWTPILVVWESFLYYI